MIQLWAEIYDPTYTFQIPNSDIRLIHANVERVLDGPGMVDVETPVLHADYTDRALSVLQEKRVMVVWYQESERVPKRQVAEFVIERIEYKSEPGGIRLMIRGADILTLLKNTTTSLGRSYNRVTLSEVLMDILPDGWSYTIVGIVNTVTARFDGTDVLKVLQTVMKHVGGHFRRHDEVPRRILFQNFGNDSGYRLVKIDGDKPLALRADNVIPFETIAIQTSSEDLVNKIIPLSAGDADSRGTIEDSTRTTPYPVQSETGPDGRDIFYIADATSVDTYGVIEKVLNFSRIAPIGTSDVSLARTATYLHDAANAYLSRHKDPITEIQARVFQQRVNFDVGDKVRVEYTDMVNVGGTPVVLKSIDELFWVMGVRESYGEDGERATLQLSSVDALIEDNLDRMIQTVDSAEVFATGYKATYNIWTEGPWADWLNQGTSKEADFVLTIPEDVLRVENVTMKITTGSTRQITINSTPVVFGPHNFADNSNYPDDMDITVNSTLVAEGVDQDGGEYDITDEIVGAGSDGRGDHTINIVQDSIGSGYVIVKFFIRGLIIPGRVT